jgi:hypothetical protein
MAQLPPTEKGEIDLSEFCGFLNRPRAKERGKTMGHSKQRVTAAIGLLSALWMLSLAGCAASTPAPEAASLKSTELSFSLNKCDMLGPGLYKCPATDKPICSPDYTGTPVECLHTDKNGNITIQQLQTQ